MICKIKTEEFLQLSLGLNISKGKLITWTSTQDLLAKHSVLVSTNQRFVTETSATEKYVSFLIEQQ